MTDIVLKDSAPKDLAPIADDEPAGLIRGDAGTAHHIAVACCAGLGTLSLLSTASMIAERMGLWNWAHHPGLIPVFRIAAPVLILVSSLAAWKARGPRLPRIMVGVAAGFLLGLGPLLDWLGVLGGRNGPLVVRAAFIVAMLGGAAWWVIGRLRSGAGKRTGEDTPAGELGSGRSLLSAPGTPLPVAPPPAS